MKMKIVKRPTNKYSWGEIGLGDVFCFCNEPTEDLNVYMKINNCNYIRLINGKEHAIKDKDTKRFFIYRDAVLHLL